DNGMTNSGPSPLTATASAIFVVSEVNDPPTANSDILPDIPTSGSQNIDVSTLLANDNPGPGNEVIDQTLTVTGVSNPIVGTVFQSANTIIFTPSAGFVGLAGFTYTISDNGTTADASDFRTANGTVSFNVLNPGGDVGVALSSDFTTVVGAGTT